MTTDNERAQPAVPFPTQWDWRKSPGHSFIRPAQAQGGCNASTAFAVANAMNACRRIGVGIPVGGYDDVLVPDLSAGEIFCCNRSNPPDCAKGMDVEVALNFVATNGVNPISDMAYSPTDLRCSVRGGPPRAAQISGYQVLNDQVAMAQAIWRNGPLIATLKVYQDLTTYPSKGNVYSWDGVSPLVNTQTVSVIGYDVIGKTWLCQNNWGPNWGLNGCFRIAFGQCDIDKQMWQITGFTQSFPYGSATGTPAATYYRNAIQVFYLQRGADISQKTWGNTSPGPSPVPGWPTSEQATGTVSPVSDNYDQLHVAYRRAADSHLAQTYWAPYPHQPDVGAWYDQILTGPRGVAIDAPPASGDPQAVIIGSSMHVLYRAGTEIWDVYYDYGTGLWHSQRLNLPGGMAPSAPAAAGDPKVANYNGAFHICYRDVASNISDVIWSPGWGYAQLTGAGGKAPDTGRAVGNPAMTVFANQLHVFYRDDANVIFDAYFDPASGWHSQDLGASSDHPTMDDPSVTNYDRFYQKHICYRDAKGNIWDNYYDGGQSIWATQQLAGAGASTGAPAAGAPPAGGGTRSFQYTYKDGSGNMHYEMHVLYCDLNSNIRDVWYDGSSWHYTAL